MSITHNKPHDQDQHLERYKAFFSTVDKTSRGNNNRDIEHKRLASHVLVHERKYFQKRLHVSESLIYPAQFPDIVYAFSFFFSITTPRRSYSITRRARLARTWGLRDPICKTERGSSFHFGLLKNGLFFQLRSAIDCTEKRNQMKGKRKG